jgi:predicted LPLAT superfamily acyltransferase
MPNLPVTASSRELQRPRPIPRRVRDVITLMVYGRIDDESGLTMQSAFILASGAGGLGFALLLWRLVLRRAYEAAHGGIRITAVSLGALARVTKGVLATALPPPPCRLIPHSPWLTSWRLAPGPPE